MRQTVEEELLSGPSADPGPTAGPPRPPAGPVLAELPMHLELTVRDQDTMGALGEYPEGDLRHEFALAALKIGVLAIRHAGTHLDADLIQHESSRLLEGVQVRLEQHSHQLHDRLTGALKEYFDPQNGRFHERVERLVQKDGELEQVLSRQIGGDESELTKTLLAHFGQQSPLMKVLNPNESQGLLAAMKETVDGQLQFQRDQLLKQFSLDNEEGALARLVNELTHSHGRLGRDLKEKMDEVVKEFSLDQENSALSRLVRNVDFAQRTIRSEFSLDNPESAFSRLNSMLHETQGAIHKNLTLDEEQSPLSRLKRELLTILKEHTTTHRQFQEDVKVALGKIMARREEAQRSTQHGLMFEDAVCAFLARETQPMGDMATPTGHETGHIKNCKVGDCVIELGPDSPAPGAKIVVEAKEDASYTLAKARDEIQRGRENRGAQWGIFAFSQKSAPKGLEPFARYGQDLFIVWDAEDAQTDVILKAAVVTARALCIRHGKMTDAQTADFESIERAILEIEKRANGLEEIAKSASTIQNASTKILERVRLTRKALETQVETLQEKMGAVNGTVNGTVD